MVERPEIVNQEEARSQAIQDYRSLAANPGWSRLQDHLAKLLMQKEKVKADAVRVAKFHEVAMNQGFIDCLNFVISEPHKKISQLSNQAGDE